MKYSKPQLLHFLLFCVSFSKWELPQTGQYSNFSNRFISLRFTLKKLHGRAGP